MSEGSHPYQSWYYSTAPSGAGGPPPPPPPPAPVPPPGPDYGYGTQAEAFLATLSTPHPASGGGDGGRGRSPWRGGGRGRGGGGHDLRGRGRGRGKGGDRGGRGRGGDHRGGRGGHRGGRGHKGGDWQPRGRKDLGGRGKGRGRGRGGASGDHPQFHDDSEDEVVTGLKVLHPLKVLEDKVVSEEEAGIRCYVSQDLPGFRGLLKHRFSDFNVNEIAPDGNVVRLRSTEKTAENDPVVKVDLESLNSEKFPQYVDLSEEERGFVPELNYKRILVLAQKFLGSTTNSDEGSAVSWDVSELSKDERRKIHLFIKREFPHLETRTDSASSPDNPEEKKSVIKIFYIHKTNKMKFKERWPQGRPKFLEFTLHKQESDLQDVVTNLANLIRAHKERFSFAGNKDKRGRTTQRMRIKWVTPEMVAEAVGRQSGPGCPPWQRKTLAAGDYRYVEGALQLGDLAGNRFEIVLRHVDDVSAVAPAARALAERGFVNYFGLQRFGTTGVRTCDVGLALIKRDWSGAIEAILAPREKDREGLFKARSHWWQYRDPYGALAKLGPRFYNSLEGRLLQGLKKCDFAKNPQGALDFLPKSMRSMYLHSYQSLVFNKVLTERLAQSGLKVAVGDLFSKEEDGAEMGEDAVVESEGESTSAEKKSEEAPPPPEEKGEEAKKKRSRKVEVVTEENIGEVSVFDLVLPLPGADVRYPENRTRFLYEVELAKDGLDIESFGSGSNQKYTLTGDYRKIVGRAKDLEWKVLKYDDPRETLTPSEVDKLAGEDGEAMKRFRQIESRTEGRYSAVAVSFSLSPSCYATMAVREMTKTSSARDVQGALSRRHEEESERGTVEMAVQTEDLTQEEGKEKDAKKENGSKGDANSVQEEKVVKDTAEAPLAEEGTEATPPPRKAEKRPHEDEGEGAEEKEVEKKVKVEEGGN